MRSVILVAITLVAITQAIPIAPSGYGSDPASRLQRSDFAARQLDMLQTHTVNLAARSARKRDDSDIPQIWQETIDSYDEVKTKVDDIDLSKDWEDVEKTFKKNLDDLKRQGKDLRKEVIDKLQEGLKEAKALFDGKQQEEKKKAKPKPNLGRFGHI